MIDVISSHNVWFTALKYSYICHVFCNCYTQTKICLLIPCYSKLVFRGHCISAVYLSHTSLPCWTTSWDGIKPLYIRDLVYGFPITEKWTYMIVFVLNCQIRTISNVMMHKLLQIITPKAFLRYISLYYKYFKIHGYTYLSYIHGKILSRAM